jgi:hypothetical protein
MGEFYKSTAYYFAVDGTLQLALTGSDTTQCVNLAKQFDYVQPSQGAGTQHQCTADEEIVGFQMVKTTQAKFQLTLP